MDTVTEAPLAIALAREGGIGVIHKNHVYRAAGSAGAEGETCRKRHDLRPGHHFKENTVGDALRLMKEHRIGGIPVIAADRTLIGIVTNRDLRFQKDTSRKIEEVMTKEGLITTHNSDLKNAAEILLRHKIEKLPVVDHAGKLIGLITYRDITKMKDNPNACKDDKGRLRVAAGVGVTADVLDRVAALYAEDVDAVVLDTAHGHSVNVARTLRSIKAAYPSLDVVAGNIATGAAARALADAGADGVKVGIGPGSICTTRVVAGVGVPQLTAIYGVAKELAGSGIPVIADGGLRYSGDIVKALAAGGDCVMVGSMLAGVEESPGRNRSSTTAGKFKSYRGMGSVEAMNKGSKDRYFQGEETDTSKFVPEGIEARVPYKGYLSETVYQLIGGLKSGMGYCGAKDIAALKHADFVKITSAGVIENHPHDVTITSEAPKLQQRTLIAPSIRNLRYSDAMQEKTPNHRLRLAVHAAHRPPRTRAERLLRNPPLQPPARHRRVGARRDSLGLALLRARCGSPPASTSRRSRAGCRCWAVCYGAQYLAQHFGGEVTPCPEPRIRTGRCSP